MSSPFQATLARWNDWRAAVHVMHLVSAPDSVRDVCVAEMLATNRRRSMYFEVRM
jgi:hypothetical protein